MQKKNNNKEKEYRNVIMNHIESLKQTEIFSKRRRKERENDRGPKEGKDREEEKCKVRMRE